MSRSLRPLAALAVAALIGAGCSSGSADNGGNGDTGTKHSTRDKAMRFAACMRQNGVRQFPDPDPSGTLTIDAVVNGSSLHPDAPAFKRAISACKDLEPAGFTGTKRSDQQQAKALEFARCIRANGVKDFPDPAKGEPLVDTRRIPSASQPGGMSILNAAMRKCRDSAAGLVKRP